MSPPVPPPRDLRPCRVATIYDRICREANVARSSNGAGCPVKCRQTTVTASQTTQPAGATTRLPRSLEAVISNCCPSSGPHITLHWATHSANLRGQLTDKQANVTNTPCLGGKRRPIFIFLFTVKFRKKDWIKMTHSPQICCYTTLQKSKCSTVNL